MIRTKSRSLLSIRVEVSAVLNSSFSFEASSTQGRLEEGSLQKGQSSIVFVFDSLEDGSSSSARRSSCHQTSPGVKKDVDDRDEWQTTLLDARRRMMMIAEKYRES